MDVYEAINEMRRKTEQRESFSFAFMSGIVKIERARLRKQSKKENKRFADYMLNFIDLDTMEYGMCWQPLLLEFNGNDLDLR